MERGRPLRKVTATVPRVAILGEATGRLIAEERDVIRSLIARGAKVSVGAPVVDDAAKAALAGLGAQSFLTASAERGRGGETSGEADRGSVRTELAEINPHAVFVTGPATLLGLVSGMRPEPECRVSARITRLEPGGEKARRWFSRSPLEAGMNELDGLVMASEADLAAVLAAGRKGARLEGLATCVATPGIDLAANPVLPMPLAKTPIRVLLSDEGADEVREEAKRIVANEMPGVEIVEIGRETASDGARPLVERAIGAAHIVAAVPELSELPRLALEGLAAGRAVIVSDVPACRRLVDERVNGVIVPAASGPDLARAILSLARRPDLLPAMAAAGRRKAERRFDAHAEAEAAVRLILG